MANDDSERQRLSAIAHAGAAMWGPIGPHTIEGIARRVTQLGIGDADLIVDLGCGPAELLRRVCERTGATGIGVDASADALNEAARRLAGSSAMERVELRLGDARREPRSGTATVALCIGPGWSTGGWAPMTEWVAGFVKPGGYLVVGEGAWARRPTPAELRRLGMSVDDHLMAPDVLTAVRRHARPLWSHRATDAEWETYADDYRSALLAWAADHPRDPLAPAATQRAGPGWAAYELLHELLAFVIVIAQRRAA